MSATVQTQPCTTPAAVTPVSAAGVRGAVAGSMYAATLR